MNPKFKLNQRLKSIHDHINTHYWVRGYNWQTSEYSLGIHPEHWFTVSSSKDTTENHMVADDSEDRDRY